MIDIKIIFSATYEEVSRSVSGRGAGGFFGALIGGILVDKFSNSLDLLIALSETIAGLAIILVPYTYTMNTLWFHYLILGMCNSIVGIGK
jgi:predicted MFS family arabinose efflux permease